MENITKITNDLKNDDSVLCGIIFELKEEKLSGDGELILDQLMKFRQNNKDNINLLGQEILNIETKKIKPLKQSVKLTRNYLQTKIR